MSKLFISKNLTILIDCLIGKILFEIYFGNIYHIYKSLSTNIIL